MKILTLIHEYPPIGGGGGRVAQDLVAGFIKAGHSVKIITSRLNGDEDQIISEQLELRRAGYPRKAAFHVSIWEMLNYDISAFFKGIKLIKSWRPDVIHAHFAVPAGAVACLLSIVTGIPYVLTVHLGDVPGAVPDKTSRWFHWVYPFTPPIWKKAAKVIAVSQFTKDLALKHYKVPINVIHNGVDLSALPSHNRSFNPSRPVRLIFAGRLTEQKKPFDLMNALGKLAGKNWTLSVMGDGPLLLPTRRLAEQLGISHQITFNGWVTPEQVLNAFAEHDILLLPSSSEGLSVVGVQALAMGLAMILSEAGGNPELINGNNGVLIPVGDVDALSNSIRIFIEDWERLKFAQQASQEYAQRFSLKMVVDQYLSVLNSSHHNG